MPSFKDTFVTLLKSPMGVKAIFEYVQNIGATSTRRIILGALLVLWYKSGGYIRFAKGKAVFFYPLWVYDTLSWVCSGLNTLINKTLVLQPRSPDWVDDKKLSPARIAASGLGQEELTKVHENVCQDANKQFKEEHLVQLFDSLPAAGQETMIGTTFRGRIVRSGCMLDVVEYALVRPLQLVGFTWGKRYRSEHVGDALLLGWGDVVYTPLPVWGNVSMNRIGFRGKDNATMDYDHQPWKDYFRVLDDGSTSGKIKILGLWTARDRTGGWFTLTEDKNTPTN